MTEKASGRLYDCHKVEVNLSTLSLSGYFLCKNGDGCLTILEVMQI